MLKSRTFVSSAVSLYIDDIKIIANAYFHAWSVSREKKKIFLLTYSENYIERITLRGSNKWQGHYIWRAGALSHVVFSKEFRQLFRVTLASKVTLFSRNFTGWWGAYLPKEPKGYLCSMLLCLIGTCALHPCGWAPLPIARGLTMIC